MANKFFLGLASNVAQVANATFGTYDAGTTRKITIGSVVVQATDSGGNLTAALTAFAVVLNASTHPYFTAITWTSNATQIIATADTAGLSFIFTASVSGGTGTCSNAYTVATANSCANDFMAAANWSDGTAPASSDTLIVANSSVNICQNLLTGITGVTLIRFEQSYTGRLGLNYQALSTSIDGTTVNTSYPEYRQCYLSIGATSWRIGDAPSFGSPSGSPRLMFDVGATTTATVEIINTSSSSADTNRPSVRILGALVSAAKAHILTVRSAPGGVGVGTEVPGEAPAFLSINTADTTSTSKVTTGSGISLTNWVQDGGNNVLATNSTLAANTINGGTLRTEGSGATTAMTIYGGTVTHNATGTTSTINAKGGTLSSFGSGVSRTWTTINYDQNAAIQLDPAVIANTTIAVTSRMTLSSS